MSRTSKELARRWVEQVWNERDYDVCDELIAEGFVEHAHAPFSDTAPGAVNGPIAMRASMDWLLRQFPDLRMTIEAMVADADLVAVRVSSEGTDLGRLNGVLPPSGRRFAARQTHWFRVLDDRIVEHWAVRDDLTTMLQLGVVGKPRLSALTRQLRSAATYAFRQRRSAAPRSTIGARQ